MRHILLSALLLACFFLPAQDFRPFLLGKTHYYAAGVDKFSIRVNAVGMAGADSAFWLNRVIGPACNPPFTVRHYFTVGHEGRMGDHFIKSADGAFRVVSQAGDTLTLHTRLPLATPWPFLSGTPLTATIQARNATMTFGVADTVLTIAVSNGNNYSLSQHFGLLSGRTFDSYFLGSPAANIQLVRPPLPPPTVDEYVDWQPGDKFTTLSGVPIFIEKYNNYTVLNRWTNANADSLWIEVNLLPIVVLPPSDRYVYAPVLDTLLYTNNMIAMSWLATGELDTTIQPIHVSHRWDYAAGFGNEVRVLFDNYQVTTHYFGFDTCGLWGLLFPPCSDPMPGQIVEGFGNVHRVFPSGFTTTTCLTDVLQLLCYRRAGDSLVCPQWLDQLVGVPSSGIQGSLQIANSASGQPQMVWEGLFAGDYRITLSDLQGRVLDSQTAYLREAGSQDIPLPGPAGIYLLRVEDLAGGGNWVVRLPKFMH
jgi:hypothetical protein